MPHLARNGRPHSVGSPQVTPPDRPLDRRPSARGRGPRVAVRLWRASIAIAFAATATPLAAGPAAPAPREVVVTTADGLALRAAFHPAPMAGGAGVVLVHGYRGTRTAWDATRLPLRDRGVHVLALDLRGHGRNAKPGKVDLGPRVDARDPTLFAAMHADVIAAVRWLVREGGCDARRVAVVGASVGGSVAVDAAARYPNEVAAIAWLSPGAKYLGLDSVASLSKVPVSVPMLLLAHRGELEVMRPVVDARPGARSVVYDEPAPSAAGAERGWAHGVRMLAHLPLVPRTLASFVAAATGSKTDDVVLDGVVTTVGPNADPWDRAAEVGVGAGDGTLRAYRVGRRVVFGGTAGPGVGGIRFEVATGRPAPGDEDSPFVGPPQVVGYDVARQEVAWSWGGMGSMPNFPGMDPRNTFGKTFPELRVARGEPGLTFEGEWFIPAFQDATAPIRLVVSFTDAPPPRPGGGVESYSQFSVEVPAR